VGFRDETGGTLSYPSLSGSGQRSTAEGKRELQASLSGSANARDELQPKVEIHAPPGDYSLYNISFRAQDGTNLTFPGFPITFECGVRKGVPISGKPRIVVAHPPAYYLTNAQTVTVSGIAADDTGISSMTVNGNPVAFAATGNPENEVSFSYELPVGDGNNTIVTTAVDLDGNESFDARPIYVDRWAPTLTIVSPLDGQVFVDPQASVPVNVEAGDRGYGFSVRIYLDDQLIHEASGPANQSTVEVSSVYHLIDALTLGAHVVRAEVIDAAGNSASSSVSITTNTDPVATDDVYEVSEDAVLNIAAPGVLTNDSDADGDSLSVAGSTPPANGSLVMNLDGSFSYTPNENYNGQDTFGYTVADGNGGTDTATVFLTVAAVNDPPVALDDSYSTDEDVPLHIPASGVLGNDTDIEGDLLTVVLVTGPSSGALTLNPDGSFDYTPSADFNGTDSFSYQANDGALASGTATVTITVKPVNDPPVVAIDVTSQTVQYSDLIAPVTVTAYDIDSPALLLSPVGALPERLSTGGSCALSGDGASCSWTLQGQAWVGAGSYAITLGVSDGEYFASAHTALTVTQEDATVGLDAGNPVSVSVSQDGGASEPFSLTVYVSETLPDLPADHAAAGDIAKASVSLLLVPVGPGGSFDPIGCDSATSGEAYAAVQTVTCSVVDVQVEPYTVAVTIGGDYYRGDTEDVLTVYDPSLGFTTGGGWFYWPDTSDKTNFGYTMKYGKNGSNVKGSLLLIRHLADGGKYRIKSNALDGLAIGQDPAIPYGWASFSGKSTYLAPGMPEAEGNHGFTVYVEDRDEPGSGVDRFWIETRNKVGGAIPAMSLAEPAPDHAVAIGGGNIVAPH